ncbi:MAG TPA: glycoside hydrolase family 25 protein [Polyangiaceae bacterium]|jgi:GH25 family lysozyme M1 (1,4-beta-N-acetylmuramidase)
MIRIVDLGSPQGTLRREHWEEMARDGIRGAYLRCGNGNNGVDPTFRANLLGARAVGIAVGVYHVGFPLPASKLHPGRAPEEQAKMHFAASLGVGSKPGTMPPALDFEWPSPVEWAKWSVTPASAIAWATVYLAQMRQDVGRDAALYLYEDFGLHLAGGPFPTPAENVDALQRVLAPFASSPFWLALYQGAAPGAFGPWTAPTIWQKSGGGGKLPNGAPVDEDLFLGNEDAWQVFLGNAPGPTSADDAAAA